MRDQSRDALGARFARASAGASSAKEYEWQTVVEAPEGASLPTSADDGVVNVRISKIESANFLRFVPVTTGRVHDVIDIGEEGFNVLTGPCGSGKTTVFRCIFWCLFANIPGGLEYITEHHIATDRRGAGGLRLYNKVGQASAKVTFLVNDTEVSLGLRYGPGTKLPAAAPGVGAECDREWMNAIFSAVRLVPQDHGLRPQHCHQAAQELRPPWYVTYHSVERLLQSLDEPMWQKVSHHMQHLVRTKMNLIGEDLCFATTWGADTAAVDVFRMNRLSGGQLDCLLTIAAAISGQVCLLDEPGQNMGVAARLGLRDVLQQRVSSGSECQCVVITHHAELLPVDTLPRGVVKVNIGFPLHKFGAKARYQRVTAYRVAERLDGPTSRSMEPLRQWKGLPLYFSSRVMIVEGDSDKEYVAAILRSLKITVPTILAAGSCVHALTMRSVAAHLNVETLSLLDADVVLGTGHGDQKGGHRKCLEQYDQFNPQFVAAVLLDTAVQWIFRRVQNAKLPLLDPPLTFPLSQCVADELAKVSAAEWSKAWKTPGGHLASMVIRHDNDCDACATAMMDFGAPDEDFQSVELQDKIFNKFVRFREETKRQYGDGQHHAAGFLLAFFAICASKCGDPGTVTEFLRTLSLLTDKRREHADSALWVLCAATRLPHVPSRIEKKLLATVIPVDSKSLLQKRMFALGRAFQEERKDGDEGAQSAAVRANATPYKGKKKFGLRDADEFVGDFDALRKLCRNIEHHPIYIWPLDVADIEGLFVNKGFAPGKNGAVVPLALTHGDWAEQVRQATELAEQGRPVQVLLAAPIAAHLPAHVECVMPAGASPGSARTALVAIEEMVQGKKPPTRQAVLQLLLQHAERRDDIEAALADLKDQEEQLVAAAKARCQVLGQWGDGDFDTEADFCKEVVSKPLLDFNRAVCDFIELTAKKGGKKGDVDVTLLLEKLKSVKTLLNSVNKKDIRGFRSLVVLCTCVSKPALEFAAFVKWFFCGCSGEPEELTLRQLATP